MIKRLIRKSDRAVELEKEYLKLMDRVTQDSSPLTNFKLPEKEDNNSLTFLVQPGQQLVEYDDNQLDLNPWSGEQDIWQSSLRWIGR